MTIRFSNDGPEFPSELVDSLLAGDVVFLCGTGVSAPQMPDFRRMVELTFETLKVEKTDSEECAFRAGRFEEVLGTLSRRLSDPNAVTRTVSELLAVPEHPSLDQHRTILRLSRDLDNRISVVTTNFDTLLERAAAKVMSNKTAREVSFAGQALPAPGSPSFSGVIHIHGRLTDSGIGLEETPLVLTSADYGDVYMRSGWASRFLFDLARCKTVVLVGYSANDAPVRYFLNVLESDRARFPDIKQVYALDAYEYTPEEATRSWSTLAVKPLPYCKVNPETGEHDHSALWRDLEELAEIVERPKYSRRERARTILEHPLPDTSAVSLKELVWLIGGRRNLWSVVINAIVDPRWFTFFQKMELWSAEDATWVISTWIAKEFQNADRFECACEWQRTLGQAFTEKIWQRLLQENGLDEIWSRVWRLFCLAEPVQHLDPAFYPMMQKQLEGGVVLDNDLRKAVSLLAPKLLLSPRNRKLRGETGSPQIERVGDIMRPRMAISDSRRAEELVNTLLGLSAHAGRILELSSAELRSALELEAELELIGDDFDVNDFTVPSIESHDQNRHREGVNFLVRVLAETLSEAATLDREQTRRVIAGWKSLPGRTGVRLSLHAMRNPKIFDADEAMKELLSIPVLDFWSIRRETARLLADRAGTASPALVNQVEERIRESGKAYYDRYTIEQGQADWRAHAHDAAVWLRLNMLKDAEVLSDIGVAELSAITKRRDYLNRIVKERDYFGAYSSGVRRVIPDPAPIVEASDDDRLQVARELVDSPEFELRQGWPEFCRSDPQRAFDSLTKGDLTPKTAVLWNQFLGGLAFGEEDSKVIRDDLSVQALNHLYEVDADTLPPMVSGLCDLISSVPRESVEDFDGWLVKLWETISKQPEEPADIVTGLYERAINSPAGKLSQRLLMEINAQKEGGNDPTRAQLLLIKSISNYKGVSGQLGRAVLVKNLAFLLTIDRQYIVKVFSPCINSKNTEGVSMRAVMLRDGSITPEVTQVFKQAIIDGVVESEATGDDAAFIASNILRPVVADFRRDNTVQWGLATTEVAGVLRKAKQAVRCGALTVLAKWLRSDPAGVEEALDLIVTPFFNSVWPKESEFLDASLTPHLIDLAVGSGNEFPKALELLRPYISPYDRGHGSLYAIAESNTPEQFPRETLDLVWLVCGPMSRGSFYEISEIIDRLIEAEPDIEVDRRLQWLEHRAERYD